MRKYRQITILGAGESGTGAAILAKNKGYNVFVSDKNKIKQKYKDVLTLNNIDFEEEKHSEEKILCSDLIIKSPGIPDKADIIQKIKSKNIDIIDEIEFASYFTKAKIIAITGSNGKTTTTMLTYHLLKNAGLNVGLAGNVGKSFALQVAQDNFDYYVIEISSFQLDYIKEFKPDIAIILNITPDHLDRYDYNFQNYINSKLRITMNQMAEDYFIYCDDDNILQENISKINIKSQIIPFSIKKSLENGGFLQNEKINILLKNKKFDMQIKNLSLKGQHNVYNSISSAITGKLIDIQNDTIRESLSSFKGVEHRLEFVLKIKNINFMNDSKATNINSAWYALESTEKPIIWIVGGLDKGNDYTELIDIVKDKVKAIVCLGKDNSKIIESFKNIVNEIYDTKSMKEAVKTAYKISISGDSVLLSPACASFDLFENYEDRGRKFKEEVRNL